MQKNKHIKTISDLITRVFLCSVFLISTATTFGKSFPSQFEIVVFGCYSTDIEDFEAFVVKARSLGATHINITADYSGKVMKILEERCKILRKHGLKAAFSTFEPQMLPEKVFTDHPLWRGARVDHPMRSTLARFAPTIDNPEVLELYRESVSMLIKRCPEIELLDYYNMYYPIVGIPQSVEFLEGLQNASKSPAPRQVVYIGDRYNKDLYFRIYEKYRHKNITANFSPVTSVGNLVYCDPGMKVYPNPFTNILIISYTVQEQAQVRLSVFDSFGKLVNVLVSQEQQSGCYSVEWDGSDMPPGVYICQLQKAHQTVI